MRSSGPQAAVAGKCAFATSVMSMPITAKSPFESSQISGQPLQAIVRAPFACGSGPILWENAKSVSIAWKQSQKHQENASTKYSVYTVVRIYGFQFAGVMVKTPKYRKVLGENIRMHRRALKWSQEKLAEQSDLHHNYIGDIERGEENVSVDTLMRIASALKIKLSDLVQGL